MITSPVSLVESILVKILHSGKTKSSAKKRLTVVHCYFHQKLNRSTTMRRSQSSFPFVDRWLSRWKDSEALIADWFSRVEGQARSPTEDREFLLSIVEDAPRSGTPAFFNPEVADQVVALALTKPEEHGIPFDRWTHQLLAEQVVFKGIAPKMSSTRVGDFLKSARHKSSPERVL
jgi:hypothetical protein